jgi:hypothetical protein
MVYTECWLLGGCWLRGAEEHRTLPSAHQSPLRQLSLAVGTLALHRTHAVHATLHGGESSCSVW